MGTFTLATFKARGVPHDVAITGRHDADLERLARDLKQICEAQIDFFGGKAPMDRYVFLVMAVGDGYGGLEHRASTALHRQPRRPALSGRAQGVRRVSRLPRAGAATSTSTPGT